MKIRILVFILFWQVSLPTFAQTTGTNEVRNYINSHWAGTTLTLSHDSAEYIGLPKPFTVPSVLGEKHFREMYYWDTYFTNLGLIRDGQLQQAINNTDNILYMVERFGKMLNGSHTRYLNRSQPPFLSLMVADIYEQTHDKMWLKNALHILEKEYRFWMTERITPIGLNAYSSSTSDEEKLVMARVVGFRFKLPNLMDSLSKKDLLVLGAHRTAECESGWDFTPRFYGNCMDYCAIDLNALLYIYELNFEKFYKILKQKGQAKEWNKKATLRKLLIERYCYDSTRKVYLDYNYISKNKSDMITAASFYPYFSGIADKKHKLGLKIIMEVLGAEHGIRACPKDNYSLTYQWADGNCWAPLQCIAYQSLKKYGYYKSAKNVKTSFIKTVEFNYKNTLNLWEKYHVETGSINVINEYKMPAFLGWTAGVYIYFDEE